MVGLKEIFQVRTISIFTLILTTIFFLASICYEKGYVNVGDKLEVFGSWLKGYKNYKTNIHTVDACIQLCKQYGQCQWWNYDPDRNECWLKRGQGIRRTEAYFNNMYTGHRDSREQCQNSNMFTPTIYQPPPSPCPNGRITTNCYGDTGRCVRCCTGGQDGSDGTKACIH